MQRMAIEVAVRIGAMYVAVTPFHVGITSVFEFRRCSAIRTRDQVRAHFMSPEISVSLGGQPCFLSGYHYRFIESIDVPLCRTSAS